MLLGQVTKALKNGPPFGVFWHVPKVPSNEPKVCAPRRPGGFKVFLEAGLQLPLSPPKKLRKVLCLRNIGKNVWCLCKKGWQDCHGLYLQDGVLCKGNVKLTSPLRKKTPRCFHPRVVLHVFTLPSWILEIFAFFVDESGKLRLVFASLESAWGLG